MKTSDVLRKAGDVLRVRGWHQGWFEDEKTGCVCPAGAINVSLGREAVNCFLGASHQTDRDFEDAMRILGDIVGVPRHFPMWNDKGGREREEVLAVVDAGYVVALQEEGVEPGDVL